MAFIKSKKGKKGIHIILYIIKRFGWLTDQLHVKRNG